MNSGSIHGETNCGKMFRFMAQEMFADGTWLDFRHLGHLTYHPSGTWPKIMAVNATLSEIRKQCGELGYRLEHKSEGKKRHWYRVVKK